MLNPYLGMALMISARYQSLHLSLPGQIEPEPRKGCTRIYIQQLLCHETDVMFQAHSCVNSTRGQFGVHRTNLVLEALSAFLTRLMSEPFQKHAFGLRASICNRQPV